MVADRLPRRKAAEPPKGVAVVLAALDPWRARFRRLSRLGSDASLSPSERSTSALTPSEPGPWDEDITTQEERVDAWLREAAALASEIVDHDPTIDERLRHAVAGLREAKADAGSLAADICDAWDGHPLGGGEDVAIAFGQPGRAWFWFLSNVAHIVDERAEGLAPAAAASATNASAKRKRRTPRPSPVIFIAALKRLEGRTDEVLRRRPLKDALADQCGCSSKTIERCLEEWNSMATHDATRIEALAVNFWTSIEARAHPSRRPADPMLPHDDDHHEGDDEGAEVNKGNPSKPVHAPKRSDWTNDAQTGIATPQE